MPVIGDPKNYYPMDTDLPVTQKGLTMRDWFAGKALAGITSNWEILKMIDAKTVNAPDGHKVMAHVCYDYADAMIAERNRRDTP